MLYLQNTEEAQVLFVPKNGQIPPGDLVFEAKSTIDLVTEINIQVVDLDISSQYMYLSVILQGEVTNGEYEYTVKSDDTVVSTGILIVGDNSHPDQYNHEIEYEQYETE